MKVVIIGILRLHLFLWYERRLSKVFDWAYFSRFCSLIIRLVVIWHFQLLREQLFSLNSMSEIDGSYNSTIFSMNSWKIYQIKSLLIDWTALFKDELPLRLLVVRDQTWRGIDLESHNLIWLVGFRFFEFLSFTLQITLVFILIHSTLRVDYLFLRLLLLYGY